MIEAYEMTGIITFGTLALIERNHLALSPRSFLYHFRVALIYIHFFM